MFNVYIFNMDNPSITDNTNGDCSSSAASGHPGDTTIALNIIYNTAMTGNNDIDDNLSFSAKFSDEVWHSPIKDKGDMKEQLKKKSYKQYQITPVGPEGKELYYYELSCIAIDLVKIFYPQKEMGLGWTNLPKNKTHVKLKIIGRIIALRKVMDDGKYVLDQNHFIGQL